MDRKQRPAFGYIISNEDRNLSNYDQNFTNIISPTPTDPGHLNTPFSSNGPSPSHSPISAKDYPIRRIPPQQACFRIDSYYRKPNDKFINTMPKTERQKSRRQRIAQLDDAIFELEQMYKKLKLSDQDLMDRAERRDLPTKFQLMRFSSASQIPSVSPTQMAKSDEELIQQQRIRLNSNNELNKRRPISAFYNQFQRTPPFRRSGVPDLIGDDQAVRRLNSPLPPTPAAVIPTSYLQQAAYSQPLNMQHQKKKNIYGHLEFDPIVDDVQYRKLSQNQLSQQPPHPPFGIPLQSTVIKSNPINDYLHSNKPNDMAVRSLRKDYSVNQTNPFAHLLRKSSSQSFFQQHGHESDELLPETTTNYLKNVKKQLKPTRSLTMMADMDVDVLPAEEQRHAEQSVENKRRVDHQNVERKMNPFVKSSSLSNCLLSGRVDEGTKVSNQFTNKPKNNIYRKQQEEQLEDMLSNLNEVTKKSPDLVSNTRFEIINRSPKAACKVNTVDLINSNISASQGNLTERIQSNMQSSSSIPANIQKSSDQSSVSTTNRWANKQERTFGLIKSPTEMIAQTPKQPRVIKSRTQGNLSNVRNEPIQKFNRLEQFDKLDQYGRLDHQRSIDNRLKGDELVRNRKADRAGPDSRNEITNRNEIKQNQEERKSIWPSQFKRQSETSQRPTNQLKDAQLNQSDRIDQSSQHSSQPIRRSNRNKQYFFMKSSSVDRSPDNGSNVPYLMPRRSVNTQVDKMKNLFESKFSEESNYVPNRHNSRDQSTFAPKKSLGKSSTQPNLLNYKYDETIDKKKKKTSKIRKPNRLKSNRSSEKFTDESEHETSSSSCDS